MNDFLNIYANLLIAIISFVAPIILYLLSVSNESIARIKRITAEKNSKIKSLIGSEEQKGENASYDKVEESTKMLKANEKLNDKMVSLLSPKKQIYWMYVPITAALFLVMVDKIVRDKVCFYNHYLSVSLIIASLLSFLFGLYQLKQVAWAIVETKEDFTENKASVTVEPEKQ